MKVAILHYHWMLQAHSVSMAEAFAQRGDEVYVFGYDLLNVLSDGHEPHVHYMRWKRWRCLTLVGKFFSYIYTRCPKLRTLLLPLFFLLAWCDRWTFFKKILRTDIRFDLFVGVEKGGAFLAEYASRIYDTPFLYYSLELYGPGSTVYTWEPLLRVLGRLELRFASKANIVLIQDRDRAAYLQGYTGVSSKKIHLFPVAVTQGHFFNHKPPRNICICFGNLYASQDSFLSASDRLPDNWHIVLHNNQPQPWLTALAAHPKIVLSDAQLDERGIDRLLCSAKVALALYPTNDENNRLIVFSSEKIARYLSKGLPFIINEDSNAETLFSQFQCGRTVQRCEDIADAIESIVSNYDFYVEQSFLAYDNFFNFEKNFHQLYERLKQENII